MASQWTIQIVAPAPMLSANQGHSPGDRHGGAGARSRKRLRRLAYQHAQINNLPRGLAKARVDVVLQFPRNARRDTANYHPYVAKPLVDALGQPRRYTRGTLVVDEPGWGTLLGDDPAHLHCGDCPHIRFGDPTGRNNPRMPHGRITVIVTDLSDTVDRQPSLFEGAA